MAGPDQVGFTMHTGSVTVDADTDEGGRSAFRRLGKWCRKWIEKGNSNSICARKEKREIEELLAHIRLALKKRSGTNIEDKGQLSVGKLRMALFVLLRRNGSCGCGGNQYYFDGVKGYKEGEKKAQTVK